MDLCKLEILNSTLDDGHLSKTTKVILVNLSFKLFCLEQVNNLAINLLKLDSEANNKLFKCLFAILLTYFLEAGHYKVESSQLAHICEVV